MFALFYSLYYSMFVGSWQTFNIADINTILVPKFNAIGELVTSIFNNVDTPMTNLGTLIGINDILRITAFVLALITSIGIVVLAVKGIKRIFAVFFTFGR